jgi:hypothetical protein
MSAVVCCVLPVVPPTPGNYCMQLQSRSAQCEAAGRCAGTTRHVAYQRVELRVRQKVVARMFAIIVLQQFGLLDQQIGVTNDASDAVGRAGRIDKRPVGCADQRLEELLVERGNMTLLGAVLLDWCVLLD